MDTPLKDRPLVSIMMATYNRADMIGVAISSVLSQSYDNWELLILDDGSTDNTREVVKSYSQTDSRIKYFPAATNLGISLNRNRGFDLAIGEYIAVLDSDDRWIDQAKLEKQVEFLETHPDHILIGTGVRVINESGETIGHFRYANEDSHIRKRMLLRNQFTHSSVMWRRDNILKENRYDETLAIWEDYELILRLGTRGKLANLEEEMTAYQKHSGNISKEKKYRGGHTHIHIIKKYREVYPNYFPAWLKGKLRLLI